MPRYDKLLTVHAPAQGTAPSQRRLRPGLEHYYREAEVYASRYWQARQAGETISMLVELPRLDGDGRITTEHFVIPEDGKVYRVAQAAAAYDECGMAIWRLSLTAQEGKYAILKD